MLYIEIWKMVKNKTLRDYFDNMDFKESVKNCYSENNIIENRIRYYNQAYTIIKYMYPREYILDCYYKVRYFIRIGLMNRYE